MVYNFRTGVFGGMRIKLEGDIVGQPKRYRWAAALSITFTALMTVIAAPDATADDSADSSSDFAVYGATSWQPGQELSADDLGKIRLDQAIVDGSSRADGSYSPAAPPPPGYPKYQVMSTWTGHDNADFAIRRGYWDADSDQGFGFDKIYWKHNLTIPAVRATTKYPANVSKVGGTTYNYDTPVNHVRCSGWWVFRKCKVVETLTVRAGHDFRKLRDGKPFGIVTAFCVNIPGRCPDWVKNAANI